MPNVPINISNIIEEFINGVNNILENRVKKVILYGSYARGDYDKSSDIDIMILTDLTDDEMYSYFVKISDMAYDIEEKNNFDISLSPLIKNIDKFNYWLEALPFYMNVQREGVVLRMQANRLREDSDYDDEYVAKQEATEAQIKTAEELIELVDKYIKSKIY